MIRINALAFLFVIQIMLIILGGAVYLFIQFRKSRKQETSYKLEIVRLNAKAGNDGQENEDLLNWKEMFHDLQENFEKVRASNIELQAMVSKLVPEAEQSEEYKNMIKQFEKNNKELDNCLGTLEKENDSLDTKIGDIEDEVKGLTRKLKDSVSKEEFDRIVADNNRLNMKLKNVKEQFDSKTEEYEKLDKNYLWLEKEYNALYESSEQEKNG